MDPLQAGIAAARQGRQDEARAWLQQALEADPHSEQGWLWMSAVVESGVERRTCLERVLTLNPGNQTAQLWLQKLDSASDASPGQSSELPAEPVSPENVHVQGTVPLAPAVRPIRRLEPRPEPQNGVAQLRAAQVEQPVPYPPASTGSDPMVAWVLIGGLSVTALAGAILLGALWLIGWPP